MTDIDIARQYDVTRNVLDFKSIDGLTFADYQAILHMSRVSDGMDRKTKMAEFLGRTSSNGKSVESFGDLWRIFTNARVHAFHYFSEKRLNLCLEDIILLDGLFMKGLLKWNLAITPRHESAERHIDFVFEHKLSTDALRELVFMIYVPHIREFVNFFVRREPGDDGLSLMDAVEFVKDKPTIAQKLLAHLEARLPESYIPEIEERHYRKLNPSVAPGLDRHDRGQFLPLMRAVGIPDEISMFANEPGVTFWELNDDVKNGCQLGSTVLHILRRNVKTQ